MVDRDERRVKMRRLTMQCLQMRVLKALYAWREDLGRQEDESVRYVLPNHLMLNIAQVMPSTPKRTYLRDVR